MTLDEIAANIHHAWNNRTQISAGSGDEQPFDLKTGYAIQDLLLDRLLADGQTVSGAKIGMSNPKGFAAMGLTEPLGGLLFRQMCLPSGTEISAAEYISPKVEGEICFTLSADLTDPAMSLSEVMQSVASIAPAIEIVDSRWAGWNGRIEEVVAENISASFYVMGTEVAVTELPDLAEYQMEMTVDGKAAAQGDGSAAYGSPVKALHWLACHLASRGRPLLRGHHVMSGAFAPMVPVSAGNHVTVDFGPLGKVDVTFGKA